MSDTASETVSFGYEEVDPEEKTRRVGAVFSGVAAKYDVMNDAMSAGMHRLWKDSFVRRVKPQAGEAILDMAGGTGDVAFRLAGRGASVTVADINQDMLDVGMERARKRGVEGLTWQAENAETLSFTDSQFDAYTIAFGIRNVTDIPKALREAHRVLKRGGRFYCLEFSTSEWPGFGQLYDRYSTHVIPRIGKAVAGDEDSYRYLVESIRRFPKPEAFRAMIADAGFAQHLRDEVRRASRPGGGPVDAVGQRLRPRDQLLQVLALDLALEIDGAVGEEQDLRDPCRQHLRQEALHAVDRAPQVDVDHARPGRIGHLPEHRVAADAGRDTAAVVWVLLACLPALLLTRPWCRVQPALLALLAALPTTAVAVSYLTPTGFAYSRDLCVWSYAAVLGVVTLAYATTAARRLGILMFVCVLGFYDFFQAFVPWRYHGDPARAMVGTFYQQDMFGAFSAAVALTAAVVAVRAPSPWRWRSASYPPSTAPCWRLLPMKSPTSHERRSRRVCSPRLAMRPWPNAMPVSADTLITSSAGLTATRSRIRLWDTSWPRT